MQMNIMARAIQNAECSEKGAVTTGAWVHGEVSVKDQVASDGPLALRLLLHHT